MTWFSRTIALVIAVLAASPGLARDVPSSFTAGADGLTAHFFAGMFACPSRAPAAGVAPGVTIYFAEPRFCDPDTAAPRDAPVEARITVSYGRNTADTILPGLGLGPPRSNAELACRSPMMSAPIDLQVLGVPAVTCAVWQDDHLSLSAGTLYDRGILPGTVPDSVVWVTLDTIRTRYARDVRVFRTVLWSVQQCALQGGPTAPMRPACPVDPAW